MTILSLTWQLHIPYAEKATYDSIGYWKLFGNLSWEQKDQTVKWIDRYKSHWTYDMGLLLKEITSLDWQL